MTRAFLLGVFMSFGLVVGGTTGLVVANWIIDASRFVRKFF